MQVNAVSHGSPVTRFRNVNVINTGPDGMTLACAWRSARATCRAKNARRSPSARCPSRPPTRRASCQQHERREHALCGQSDLDGRRFVRFRRHGDQPSSESAAGRRRPISSTTTASARRCRWPSASPSSAPKIRKRCRSSAPQTYQPGIELERRHGVAGSGDARRGGETHRRSGEGARRSCPPASWKRSRARRRSPTTRDCSPTIARRHPCSRRRCARTDGTGSGWAGATHHDWSRIDPSTLGARATQKARTSVNPVAIEPGRYTVVFEPTAVGNLVQFITGAFNARAADEGRSFFSIARRQEQDRAEGGRRTRDDHVRSVRSGCCGITVQW